MFSWEYPERQNYYFVEQIRTSDSPNQFQSSVAFHIENNRTSIHLSMFAFKTTSPEKLIIRFKADKL